jgi:1-acyl-sn-glycerol-3-phosphate acyltransferase
MLYWLYRALARLTLHLFFRRIEVEGLENVPDRGPVLFLPNHSNALVDPLVILTATHRRLTVTAKNVLAKNPLLGTLMRALGVITFHRREDVGKGSDPRQNVQSLQRCRDVLAARGALCLFPEGVSHSDPSLRPFHTGAGRIALDFVRLDGNPGGLKVIPVGLLYTEKDRFRSAVWLRFGDAIDAGRYLAEHPEAGAAELIQEVRQRVAALTPNYENRREELIVTRAAGVVATGGDRPPALGLPEPAVADWFRLVNRLQAGYLALRHDRRDEIDELTRRVRRYGAELRRLGIDPGEVYLPLHFGRALLFLIRELELMIVGFPLALFGAVNHLISYLIVKYVARRLSKDKDHWATNVIYPSFVVFPFFYAIQLTAAWLLLPTGLALLYTVALPYTGYYALLYSDRLGKAARRTRTFFYFLAHRQHQQELAREGREILARIRQLAELLESRDNEASAVPRLG